MKNRIILSAIGLVAVLVLTLGLMPSASAHEGREVGDYTISIGWRVEPAYVGVANGPEFTIAIAAPASDEAAEETEAAHDEAEPTAEPQEEAEPTEEPQEEAESTEEAHAEGTEEQPHTNQAAAEGHGATDVDDAILNATDTLTLTVHFGDQSRKLPLIADRETPGRFFADLIPTRPGDYSFRLTGTLGDIEIDEEFSSANGEFSTIEPAGDLLFPDTKADAVSLQSEIAALKTQVEALQAALDEILAGQE